MKLFGPDAETGLAQYIMAENIETLEEKYVQDLDLNAPFEITKYIEEPPIVCSIS
ncbi:hypothetical protein AAG747_25825 [Rapidithrix thailandica]|uniref:Uncharacterized protein n=1 Tax=Rapidithrix thailandica TaxID=413964 RepID=A0AAW9SKU1_9BACT